MKLRRFIPVLLIVAGLWAYHNSFHGPFIFDDVSSIPENPHIHGLWPIREAVSAPPDSTVAGRPVVCLSLALNYAWGGLNVWGYHVVNVGIHILAALTLYGVVRRTFSRQECWSTGVMERSARSGDLRRTGVGETDAVGTPHGTPAAANWLAAAIALIWEVHPLQTESVTYIVQRTELLMGLFLLLTVYCTLRGSQSSRPRVWYLAAVISCALGMGSKEVMVGAPLIVLLYDRVFLAASFRELWRRRMGLYVGLAATWLWLAALVANTPRRATGFGFETLTPWDYLMTEAGVILYYLRLCFWPHPLVIDYYDWPVTRLLKDGVVPGLVVLGLLGATAGAFRRRPWLGFLGAWFFLILAPTSSFLPSGGEVIAERRMYLPLAAVVTLAVVGAFALGRRLWNKPMGAAFGCVATASVVGLFIFLTIQRNEDYRSDMSIWRDTVEKRPQDPRANYGLGFVLMGQGRLPEAIGCFEQALRFNPGDPKAHNNLGLALVQLGRVREAMEQWDQALRAKPDYADAHFNLGLALMGQGRPQEAIDHYEQVLRIKPDDAEAHNNLGLALAQLGRVREAMEHWEQALRTKPDYVDAHYNLGVALEQAGRVQEAIQQYQQALQVNPDFVPARDALARARAIK